MTKFIEVHEQGNPRLINLDMVEVIYPTDNGAQIFFAHSGMTVDESYCVLQSLIWR